MTVEETLPANSNLVMGHSFPGDKVYYWTEGKSKIKSDGSHGGKWIKGKLVSVDGSMVGVDLGTRMVKVKVNISKIRKDHNPVEDVDVPLQGWI
jgi:ribosome maturation factor RimP